MPDNIDYVPANIVKMLFEQSQHAIESNTLAVKEMTNSVNELAKIIALPPSNRDILDEVKVHENQFTEKIKEVCYDKEEVDKENKTELEKYFKVTNDNITEIKTDVGTLKSRVNTMIAVVLIVFSLLAISYLFVSSSIHSSIETHVSQAMDKNKPK